MTPRAARTFLSLHTAAQAASPKGQRAVQDLRKSPDLTADYERQLSIDGRAAEALANIRIPETIATALAESAGEARAARGRLRFNPRDPATLSVIIGFLLLVGLLTWHFLGRSGVFPEEALTIAAEGVQLRTEQYEVVEEQAGALEDWFLLKGFEKFRIPKPFDRYQAAGARLIKVENQPVAILAIPENFMFFMVFDPRPLGIDLQPEGRWRTAEFNFKYAAAIRQDRGMCFMIVIQGTRKDIEALLSKAR